MTELHELTIADAREMLASGEISALELTQACLDRIVAVDNQVRAFLAIDDESALEQARLADDARGRGRVAPLTRHSFGHQRCHLDRGADDYLWIENARGIRSAL